MTLSALILASWVSMLAYLWFNLHGVAQVAVELPKPPDLTGTTYALAAGILAQPEMKTRGAHVEYLDNTDGLLTYVHRSHENGRRLKVRRWFRFAIRGTAMILATFSHVAPESPDDAESSARRATMFDREIRNAVIGDIGVGGDGDPS